jgi:hypothetical protein
MEALSTWTTDETRKTDPADLEKLTLLIASEYFAWKHRTLPRYSEYCRHIHYARRYLLTELQPEEIRRLTLSVAEN